jgi:hypothetical protein
MNYFVVRMNLILQRLGQNVTTEEGSDMERKNATRKPGCILNQG